MRDVASPEVVVDLRGQVALVTGAGRGIGRAIAIAYAGAGAVVVLVARTTAQLEQVAAEIASGGAVAHVLAADVTDRGGLTRAIDEAVAIAGRLDIVVANAGAVAPDVAGIVVDDFDYVVDVNLSSVHRLARLVEPHLRARGGKFIVIGSGAGRRPLPGVTAYSVAKAAVAMLVRALAIEWRGAGIAVNEVVPGPVRTAMATPATGDGAPRSEVMRGEWFKTPDDVVPVALFVAGLPNHGPSGQTFSLLGRDL